MSVRKNSLYNLVGFGLPSIIAVFTIPMLIDALGLTRFGLLTIVWAVVSYFGLFDFGLGRTLTQKLSIVYANGKHCEIGPLVTTATLLMLMLGLIAGTTMSLLAIWGVGLIKDVPDNQELISAVYGMAFSVPAIVLIAGFRGMLEVKSEFAIINFIRIPMGIFTFGAPLAVVLCIESPRLDIVSWTLAIGRIVACCVFAYFAWRSLPSNRGKLKWDSKLVKSLLTMGGWMSVSNTISPIMGYADGFVIASVISASIVAYYTTPMELVTKLLIIPFSLTSVIFPKFSSYAAGNDSEIWCLFKRYLTGLYWAMLPLSVIIGLFSHEILAIWINTNFADQSAIPLTLFAVGIFVESLAHMPFTLIQSRSAAKLTALAHLVELPLYLFTLWWLTLNFGLIGTCMAWLIRKFFDTSLMFFLCSKVLRISKGCFFNSTTIGLGLLAITFFAGALIDSILIRACFVALIITISALVLHGLSKN